MALNDYNKAFKELKKYNFKDNDGKVFKAKTLEEAEQIVSNNQAAYLSSLEAAKNDIDYNFLKKNYFIFIKILC